MTYLLCVRGESKSARCHKRSSPHNAEGFFGSFIWCRRGGKTTVGRLFLIPGDQNVLDGRRGSEEASLLAGSWNSDIFSAQSESIVGMIFVPFKDCALHIKGCDVTKGSATSPQISSCSPVLFLLPSKHAEEPAKRQFYQEADIQAVNRGLNSLLAENIVLKAKCGTFDPTKQQILWGNDYWKKEKNRKITPTCCTISDFDLQTWKCGPTRVLQPVRPGPASAPASRGFNVAADSFSLVKSNPRGPGRAQPAHVRDFHLHGLRRGACSQ